MNSETLGHWRWCKTEVYHNDADANAALRVGPLSAAEDHTSFLAELDITGSLLLTQHCSVRAGYEFLWIDGIAEVDQAPFIITTGNLDLGNTAFYHGAFLGFEVTH